MPRFYEGTTTQPGDGRFAVVVSRYNAAVTEKLLAGSCRTFQERGVRDDAIDVARVPGAWEIPLIAQRHCADRRLPGGDLPGGGDSGRNDPRPVHQSPGQ